MDGDFKRPLGPVSRNSETEANGEASIPSEVAGLEPSVDPDKKKRSRAPFILTILLLIAVVGAGLLGYLWWQEQERTAALTEEKANTQASLDAANTDISASAEANAATEKIASYSTFSQEYNDILAAEEGVNVNQEEEVGEIEVALKEQLDIVDAPEGWAVLSIYQVVKPETPPSGDLYALVYLPATEDKSAQFLSFVKPVDGEWKHEELL